MQFAVSASNKRMPIKLKDRSSAEEPPVKEPPTREPERHDPPNDEPPLNEPPPSEPPAKDAEKVVALQMEIEIIKHAATAI
jgi:hypothetical protein